MRSMSPENDMRAYNSAPDHLPLRTGTPEFTNPQQYFHHDNKNPAANNPFNDAVSGMNQPQRVHSPPKQAAHHHAQEPSMDYSTEEDFFDQYAPHDAQRNDQNSLAVDSYGHGHGGGAQSKRTLSVRNGAPDMDDRGDGAYGGI